MRRKGSFPTQFSFFYDDISIERDALKFRRGYLYPNIFCSCLLFTIDVPDSFSVLIAQYRVCYKGWGESM